MNTTDTMRRSKIYTYFYGRNTVFQQFLIVVGLLFFMLTGVAAQANQSNYEDKYERLQDEYSDAQEAYSDAYYDSVYLFDVDRYEYVDVSRGDEHYDEKRAYNDALEDYENAKEAYEDFSMSGSSDSFVGGLLEVLGWFAVVVGILWIIYKKWSFNRDGEHDYDEELKECIAEAKKKGLEKLNIIADQIERVEPVVLNGVAHTDGSVVEISRGIFKNLFRTLWRFILKFDKFILGIIVAALFTGITFLISVNMVLFVIMFLIALGGVGAGGYFIYKKFEMESYVSPHAIERLTRFTPNFISKLGSDDAVRVSLPAITVYMFGDDQLYMYYQYLDIVTGRIFCEGVHEYFYEDIVGITSSQETKKIFKRYGFMKLFFKSIDYLKESIMVVSSGCTHKESYIVDIGNSLLDTQFIGMRNLIRQKKAEK